MTLIDRILGKNNEEPMENETSKPRLTGKIIKVSPGGWGFISSKDIEFTRIFFHWTGLQQNTLHFKELKKGMQVEFEPLEVEGKGYRAIKIKVLDNEPNSK